MRFRVVRRDAVAGIAASRDGRAWCALFEGDPDFPGLLSDIVRRGGDALSPAARQIEHSGAAVDLASLETLVPFPRPGKLLCVGLNYLDHCKEGGMAVPDYPTLFARFSTGLVAHGQPLVAPRESDLFDYESELVVVIGKAGRRISEADALDHVVGYTIFNDGSVRDYQLRTPQWTIGKNFDGTGALGPDFITADELPAGAEGLRIQGRLNGRTVQDSSISDMVFGVRRLVSLISVAMTLEAGDLIATGTPAGVGGARKPPLLLKDGDVFEVEIERIGVLRNPVVKER